MSRVKRTSPRIETARPIGGRVATGGARPGRAPPLSNTGIIHSRRATRRGGARARPPNQQGVGVAAPRASTRCPRAWCRAPARPSPPASRSASRAHRLSVAEPSPPSLAMEGSRAKPRIGRSSHRRQPPGRARRPGICARDRRDSTAAARPRTWPHHRGRSRPESCACPRDRASGHCSPGEGATGSSPPPLAPSTRVTAAMSRPSERRTSSSSPGVAWPAASSARPLGRWIAMA